MTIVRRSILVQGYINTEFVADHYADFLREVGALVASGRVRYREDIVEGHSSRPVIDPNVPFLIAASLHGPRVFAAVRTARMNATAITANVRKLIEPPDPDYPACGSPR
jgi:hypothetical protein